MVGHRFVQAAIERGLTETYDVVVRRRGAAAGVRPGRAHLVLRRSAPTSCRCCPTGAYDDPRVRLRARHRGRPAIDRDARTVDARRRPRSSRTTRWCSPPAPRRSCRRCPGRDLPGCFVYRTIEDLEAIREAAAGATTGAVIGGGLLGLEAANALRAARPGDPRRRDGAAADAGAGRRRRRRDAAPAHRAARRDRAHRRGHRGGARRRRRGHRPGARRTATRSTPTSSCSPPASGPATSWPATPASTSPSAAASWSTSSCRTSDPHVCAIGECAAPGGRMYGLVAPGYAMAEVVVDALLGGAGRLHRRRHVHQAQAARRRRRRFGDAFATTEGALELVYADAVAGRLQEARRHATTASGCSAASWSATRRRTASCGRWSPAASRCPENPEELILPAARAASAPGVGLPDEAVVCSCNDVTKGDDPSARSTSTPATTCRASRRAPGPAPPAAPACRCVKKLVEDDFAAERPGRRQGPLRALRAHPAGAVRPRRGARLHAGSTTSSRRTAAAAAATSASRRSPRSWPACSNAHVLDRRHPRRCRTPTTPTSPTSSATAPTRSCRASPAARSPPRS